MKFKTLLLLLLISVFMVMCKKEGLSKTTGNLELTLPWGDNYTAWTYYIYTESQYNLFLQYQPAVSIRNGISKAKGIVNQKELPAGLYGIHFYSNGTGYKRSFYIYSNKVNKYTLP